MKLMKRMTLYNIIYNEYLSWNLLVLLEIYLFIISFPYRRAKGDKSSGEAIARGKVAMIYKCDTKILLIILLILLVRQAK